MFCLEYPMDISVFLLTVLKKTFLKGFEILPYILRAIGGFIFTFAEGFVMISEMLKGKDVKMEITYSCAGLYVVLLVILAIIGIIAVKTDNDRMIGIFFVVFKIMNLFMALIIGAGVVYGKDNLGLSNWHHTALVICVGIDIVIDPIEIIIFFCGWCGGFKSES